MIGLHSRDTHDKRTYDIICSLQCCACVNQILVLVCQAISANTIFGMKLQAEEFICDSCHKYDLFNLFIIL